MPLGRQARTGMLWARQEKRGGMSLRSEIVRLGLRWLIKRRNYRELTIRHALAMSSRARAKNRSFPRFFANRSRKEFEGCATRKSLF